jgi:hypothetical protein
LHNSGALPRQTYPNALLLRFAIIVGELKITAWVRLNRYDKDWKGYNGQEEGMMVLDAQEVIKTKAKK